MLVFPIGKYYKDNKVENANKVENQSNDGTMSPWGALYRAEMHQKEGWSKPKREDTVI